MTKENMMTDADAELLRLCDEWTRTDDVDPILAAARESVRLREENARLRTRLGLSSAKTARLAGGRWGVWCIPTEARIASVQAGGCGPSSLASLSTDPGWASGPDGELVLYEMQARHLAAEWNRTLGTQFSHEAREWDPRP